MRGQLARPVREGGVEKRAGRNPSTALRADPTTMSRWSTPAPGCSANSGSAMTRRVSRTCCTCSPSTVTALTIPSRSPSRPPGASWLAASGRRVYAINPMAVARYRDRHADSRKKSESPGRRRPGEHPAHGHRVPPSAATRLQPGQGDCRPRASSAGRGLGPHTRPQPAPITLARVLPRDPRCVRSKARTAAVQGGPPDPGDRAHSGRPPG